jgi:hypothetical protein
MVGLIIVVLVLGLLMSIAMSNTVLVRSEVGGQGAKDGYKKAYFAALSGVHFAISRLRNDSPANTFSANGASRLYFAFSAPDDTGPANNHYKTINGVSNWTNYAHTTAEVASDSFAVSTGFTVNTEVDPNEYRFTVCSYPGADLSGDYWVKSQGSFTDTPTGTVFQAQAWAFVEISNPSRTLALKKFGIMTIQPRSRNSNPGINDFWDWQDTFD